MQDYRYLTFFAVSVLLWCDEPACGLRDNMRNSTGISDFVQAEKSLSRIALGSCMNGMFAGPGWHKEPQFVWKQILKHQPDLWMWLGDAAYADTRILPLVWKSSPLPLMAKYFRRQKNHPDYQEFLRSGIRIVGVWDDHDYGMNDGGKDFKHRLQSQNIYLDFIDEPLDSLRRTREGMFVSYTFGSGDRAVKLILLDVRSFAVRGSNCDLLGQKQWEWLAEQLNDPTPVAFTIVASGIQILSNAPLLQNWDDCPQSYDRLIWLTRQREKVIYLSGDVHFGEISCLNSTSSGYPLYELTSSSLYVPVTVPHINVEQCKWLVRHVADSDFRIKDAVVERNFGIIEINWDSTPIQIKLQIFGEKNTVESEIVLTLDHLRKRFSPENCAYFNVSKADPTKKYIFWSLFSLTTLAIFVVSLCFLFLLYKIFLMVLRALIWCLPVRKPRRGTLKAKEKSS